MDGAAVVVGGIDGDIDGTIVGGLDVVGLKVGVSVRFIVPLPGFGTPVTFPEVPLTTVPLSMVTFSSKSKSTSVGANVGVMVV